MNEVKLIINQHKKENYVNARYRHKEDPISHHINKSLTLITELEIVLGVQMLQKDAEYYQNLINENKDKKAVVKIKFVK
jgi:hypothetical protein